MESIYLRICMVSLNRSAEFGYNSLTIRENIVGQRSYCADLREPQPR